MDFNKTYIVKNSECKITKNSNQPKAVPLLTTLNGTLFIVKEQVKNPYGENIRIGLGIKASTTPRKPEVWRKILNKSSFIKDNKKCFQQTEKSWFERGAVFVIPTPVFGQTRFKLVLEPSALLATGFIIEIYLRKFTVVHPVEPQATLAAGATIEFKIIWDAEPNALSATPTVKASTWKLSNQREEKKENQVQPGPSQPGTSKSAEKFWKTGQQLQKKAEQKNDDSSDDFW